MPAYTRKYEKTSSHNAAVAAPNATPTNGTNCISLADVWAFRVSLKADVAGNFTGGHMRCYYWDEDGLLHRNPDLDLKILPDGYSSVVAPRVWPDQETIARVGFVAYVPDLPTHDGVGVSVLTTKVVGWGARVVTP